MLLTLLLACGAPADAPATTVTFDPALSGTSATTVQGAIDELYTRCKTAPVVAEAPVAGVASDDVAGRVQVLELRLAELLASGTHGADKVAYDPRATTLAGKTVQDALTELEARVSALERGTVDQGEPGPGLFELRDKNGKLVPPGGPQGGPDAKGGSMPAKGGPQGGQPGSHGGPVGPPPGGQGGGGQRSGGSGGSGGK